MFELVRSIQIDADRAIGVAEIAEHPMLLDHFPGRAIVPGTWLVELAAQIAGPLAEEITQKRHGVERWAVLAMIAHAKFPGPVDAPSEIRIEASIVRSEPRAATVQVVVHRNDASVLRAELVFAMIDAPPGSELAVAARHERIARWKSAFLEGASAVEDR